MLFFLTDLTEYKAKFIILKYKRLKSKQEPLLGCPDCWDGKFSLLQYSHLSAKISGKIGGNRTLETVKMIV